MEVEYEKEITRNLNGGSDDCQPGGMRLVGNGHIREQRRSCGGKRSSGGERSIFR